MDQYELRLKVNDKDKGDAWAEEISSLRFLDIAYDDDCKYDISGYYEDISTFYEFVKTTNKKYEGLEMEISGYILPEDMDKPILDITIKVTNDEAQLETFETPTTANILNTIFLVDVYDHTIPETMLNVLKTRLPFRELIDVFSAENYAYSSLYNFAVTEAFYDAVNESDERLLEIIKRYETRPLHYMNDNWDSYIRQLNIMYEQHLNQSKQNTDK